MRVLLFPVGSYGDVHPFIGLACELQRRGHQVRLHTSEHFRELTEKSGVPFEPVDTIEEYQQTIKDPNLFHPLRGFGAIARNIILPWQRRHYQLAASAVSTGNKDVVLVGSALSQGLQMAREKLGVPLVTIHLQPAVFWSNIRPPRLTRYMPAGPAMPRWWNAGIYRLAQQVMVDPVLKGPINQFRRELGLPPVARSTQLWHSPQKVIGLFPEWYAPQQPDWPVNSVLTNFPLWDESTLGELDPEVLSFLQAGDRPIVFTPGSAMLNGQSFFAAATAACQLLGRRGILLTRFPEQLPSQLPCSVRHIPYAPLSQLLPHCAALVYHGGIGTLSQACAAGVPHLIMPMSHDQPDNAERIERMGVGATLYPNQFRAGKIAEKMQHLLQSEKIAAACHEISARMTNHQGLAQAADEIESMRTIDVPGK